jgi:hypothetical protein
MMHLTTARIFGISPEKNWDPSAIADELRPILNYFVTKLSPLG